jgi:hypothetical protein
MIDREWAEKFAGEWIDAWNAHDIDRIFSYYADDFEMTSPLIISRMNVPDGRLKGKEAIRPYWLHGLLASPPLRFELLSVFTGVNSVAILYRSVTAKRTVVEHIEFDENQKGVRAEALHGRSE